MLWWYKLLEEECTEMAVVHILHTDEFGSWRITTRQNNVHLSQSGGGVV